MATVKFHKYVNSLPSTLEASTMYFVRRGAGFDIYVTNQLGFIVAYPLNQTASTYTPENEVLSNSLEEIYVKSSSSPYDSYTKVII